MWALTKKYPVQILAATAIGTLIGALPRCGRRHRRVITYAISKKFSKEPEKFGTGCVEGIVEAGICNNSALPRLDSPRWCGIPVRTRLPRS